MPFAIGSLAGMGMLAATKRLISSHEEQLDQAAEHVEAVAHRRSEECPRCTPAGSACYLPCRGQRYQERVRDDEDRPHLADSGVFVELRPHSFSTIISYY